MSEENELLREIRDLLLIIAEPALAKRDERLREVLLQIVGKSKVRSKAVLLMDGSRSQAEIKKQSGIDQGQLSRCVKALREAALVGQDGTSPKLAISISPAFFDNEK